MGDQTLLALGGELLVDYAVNIKRLMGQDTFMRGYSNGVMAYIPSLRVLREGGYEGSFSQRAPRCRYHRGDDYGDGHTVG